MTLRLTLSDHLKYLKQLKYDLKHDYKTPLRKRDRLTHDNIHNRIRDNGSK
jgi:hypothetical protein